MAERKPEPDPDGFGTFGEHTSRAPESEAGTGGASWTQTGPADSHWTGTGGAGYGPQGPGSRGYDEHTAQDSEGLGPGARVDQEVHRLGKIVADKAQTAAEQGRASAIRKAAGISAAFRSASDSLRENNAGRLGLYGDKAAERASAVENYLRSHDVSSIVDDLAEVSRRQRGLFLAGAFIAGAVVGRIVRDAMETMSREGESR